MTLPLLIMVSSIRMETHEFVRCDLVSVMTMPAASYVVLWTYFDDANFHAVAWFPDRDWERCGRVIYYRQYVILFRTLVWTECMVDLEMEDRRETEGKYSRGELK